jgi:hypothetical protein
VPTVTLANDTHDRLRLVAAALGVSEADAIDELLRRLTATGTATAVTDDGRVAIHVVYKGQRIEAEFDPQTESVAIASGPLAGKNFTSPSRAAIEVVRSINPKVHPNRNGWGFWIVSATGHELQSLRRR